MSSAYVKCLLDCHLQSFRTPRHSLLVLDPASVRCRRSLLTAAAGVSPSTRRMLPASNNRSPNNGSWITYKVIPLPEGVSLADDASVPAAFLFFPEQSPHREARQQINGS